MTPYFFGYGSLVNRATHTYPDARSAQLEGWRRTWVQTQARDAVFLSVEPDPASTIDGLIAAVPDADWAALDLRETGYDRLSSGAAVRHDLPSDTAVSHYAVPQRKAAQSTDAYIILSYLDIVVQGFLREFGAAGVARFFASTSGWETPILNDRAAPRYPRYHQLDPADVALVDHHIATLPARVK